MTLLDGAGGDVAMSWSDLKRRYERGEFGATQSTEDMAARRILHCLGLTEKTLWRRERETGLNNGDPKTLYERACDVARERPERIVLPPVRDVKSEKEAEDTLMELCETLTFHPTSGACALVYRVKGGKDLRALISKGQPDVLYLPEMPLPCTLRMGRDGKSVLACCDAEAYYATILGNNGRQ